MANISPMRNASAKINSAILQTQIMSCLHLRDQWHGYYFRTGEGKTKSAKVWNAK